jgi:hypothetical protein
MPPSPRDEEFSAFVTERHTELLRSAWLLTAGGTHLAEELVQTALAASDPGAVVPVSGRAGRLTVQDHTQVLICQDTHGYWVVIQAPTSLGWDDSQPARFAAGVQVAQTPVPAPADQGCFTGRPCGHNRQRWLAKPLIRSFPAGIQPAQRQFWRPTLPGRAGRMTRGSST